MPDDELKIRVRTPGADRAKRDLKGVAAAEGEVGRQGRDVERSAGRQAGLLSRLGTRVTQLAGAYLGLQGARMILSTLRQETERIDRATRSALEAMRGVQALSSMRGERKEVRETVFRLAAQAGRKPEEVATAYYALLGGTAGMRRERQTALMQQALLMGKTAGPGTSLVPMVKLFSVIGTQQPDMTPRQIGNLVSRTIEQAASTPEEMAQYLPDILTTARAGGVDPATAAAMFAFGTKRGGGVATSGTAVRAALLGLIAMPPDTAKQLRQYGYDPSAPLIEKLGWLGTHGQALPPELIAGIGGRRGLQAVSAIAAEPAAFGAEAAGMRTALAAPGSALERKLREMYAEVPAQRYLDQLQQVETLLTLEDVTPKQMGVQAKMAALKLLNRKTLTSPLDRAMAGAVAQTYRYMFGKAPPGILDRQVGALYELIEEGYAPTDIMEHLEFTSRQPLGPTRFGEDIAGQWREQLRAAGVQPMQGAQQVNVGGTHYHVNDGRDPAGRPREIMAP